MLGHLTEEIQKGKPSKIWAQPWKRKEKEWLGGHQYLVQGTPQGASKQAAGASHWASHWVSCE